MPCNPFIVIAEDDRATCYMAAATLEKAGFKASCCQDGSEALKIIKEKHVDLVLTDFKMPEMDGLELLKTARGLGFKVPFIIMTAYGCVDITFKALEYGASAFLTKPIEPDVIVTKTKKILCPGKSPQNFNCSKNEIRYDFAGVNMIGAGREMKQVYKYITKAAASEANVLITGESGTGKELTAKAIHCNGKRKNGPFIAVNCSVFSKGTLESELFGHVKGAFTDAVNDRRGRFEMADQGTLFIDEIGDIPIDTQVKLLRVFQEKQFERVGGEESIFSNFRLIAATNKNLKERIESGMFREDLYYRINVIHIHTPPLRERMTDTPDLLKHFLEIYNGIYHKNIKTLSVEALKILHQCQWRGNIRQLENVIESAVAMCEMDMIDVEHLPPEILDTESILTYSDISPSASLPEAVAEFEKQMILQALKTHNGIKTHAAKALGIGERGLTYKMGKYGIAPRR